MTPLPDKFLRETLPYLVDPRTLPPEAKVRAVRVHAPDVVFGRKDSSNQFPSLRAAVASRLVVAESFGPVRE